MITKYIKDDIIKTDIKYIAHGVNCQNVMGSGVAKALYDKYPEVKKRYHEYCENMSVYKGVKGADLLGRVCSTTPSNGRVVFNMFTQEYYGYDGKRYVNYAAIVKGFEKLVESKLCFTLAIPKIGCGLAGGDWDIVEQLINDTVGGKIEVWVYEL